MPQSQGLDSLADMALAYGKCNIKPLAQARILNNTPILARPDDTSSRSLAFHPLHFG